MPPDLTRRMSALARSPREIPKAAVTLHGSLDLLRLLEVFEALGPVPKVLLGMGGYGFATRVLATRLGSLFCYSSPPQESAAPGHVDPKTLDELFRYHQVGGTTQVFGIIGNPVMHSLSPGIHNPGFTALGRDALYVPFLVDALEPFFQVADRLGIQGLSVTVPYKEKIIPHLARQDQSVSAIGACNTIRRGADGKWEGTNTDAPGFLSPLLSAFGGKLPPGLKATVIGAGGASRAVVHALAKSGAQVLVLNRTASRAEQLAREFNVQAAPLESGHRLMAGFNELIVQTTKVGMSPIVDEDPVPGYRFTGSEVAYDLVYAPRTTRFLKRALAAGCRIIHGDQMLLAQAFEQFRFFTGSDYPEAAKAGLSSLTESD